MNSSIDNILEILSKAKSLNSIGFSSGYGFSKIDIDNFFDELIEATEESSQVFSGIIILEKEDDIGNYTIVDGVQRLTTISLLLCALCELYKNISYKNNLSYQKIMDRYLTDGKEVKLKLTKDEKQVYNKIVFSEQVDDKDAQSTLFLAYQEFLFRIMEKKITATELFKVLLKVQFMVITTEKTDFLARELYQSLNKTDSESQINLITSFISQKCEFSSHLWKKIISSFNNMDLSIFLAEFVRDFLSSQTNKKAISQENLYKEFKNYFNKISKYQSSKLILENMQKYSDYYIKILRADFENSEVRNQINLINERGVIEVYPYLMEVMDDFECGHIDAEVFQNLLNMIGSVVVNKDESSEDFAMNFSNLSYELNKMIATGGYVKPVLDSEKLTINEINHLTNFEV